MGGGGWGAHMTFPWQRLLFPFQKPFLGQFWLEATFHNGSLFFFWVVPFQTFPGESAEGPQGPWEGGLEKGQDQLLL